MASSFWNIAYQQAMKSGVLVAKVYSFLHVTTNYLAFPAYAFGPSMIPTLHPSGNVVLAERISKPSRGDVVVFQSPEDPNKLPTKRVVGLEGDSVSFVVDPGKNDESRTIVVPKDAFLLSRLSKSLILFINLSQAKAASIFLLVLPFLIRIQ